MANITGKQMFSPGLFDLAQDINGGLPLQVIGQWVDSPRDQATALNLLAPHQVTGYSVSSDTAGLSRLTKQLGLLEVLAVINRPKEIVYGLGLSIGGQGLGIWAADNTQMFYPPEVSAASLLSALLTMQDQINQSCRVKIGLGAHFGQYYALSGGLYGAEADAIEELTENETEGGEIVITQSVFDRLPPDHGFTLVEKDNDTPLPGRIFRVSDGPRLNAGPVGLVRYPIPYSESFYADLVAYQNCLDDTAFGERLARQYMRNQVVVLIERASIAADTHEVALFNNLSLSALLKDTGLRLTPAAGAREVKVNGPLGIYLFDEAASALDFARAFRQSLAEQDVACRIGLDAGPVLVFDLAGGGSDIAGMPVNIASKMAQDKGRMGGLYLSQAVMDAVRKAGGGASFTELRYNVSGVDMAVYEG
ncbi:MAG: family 3 adenylate cyclase [Blastocatellia bacterium]